MGPSTGAGIDAIGYTCSQDSPTPVAIDTPLSA